MTALSTESGRAVRRSHAGVALAIAGCLLLPASFITASPARAQASNEPHRSSAPDGVIIQVAPGASVADVVSDAATEPRPTVEPISGPAFEGAVVASDEIDAESLADDPRVLAVEPDQILSLHATPAAGVTPRRSTTMAAGTGGQARSWGLDRVDQRQLPLDGKFTPLTGSAAVHIYILDSGVDMDHPAFAGRVGRSTVVPAAGATPNDCDGHGTHVAGTAASTSHGIAPNAVVHSVRVLNCDGQGSLSGIIEGLNWVATNAEPRSIVNLSLGGRESAALDAAATNLTKAGVAVVAASGNSSKDACNYSPANTDAVLTVGAATRKDEEANFSNFGPCVDLYAPGVQITSLANNKPAKEVQMSGTSMAAPHVTGALAALWGKAPSLSGTQARNLLRGMATHGVMQYPWGQMGSPNRNLYLQSGFSLSSASQAGTAAKVNRVRQLQAKRKGQRLVANWKKPKNTAASDVTYRIRLVDKNSGSKSRWFNTQKTKKTWKGKVQSRYQIRVKAKVAGLQSKARADSVR